MTSNSLKSRQVTVLVTMLIALAAEVCLCGVFHRHDFSQGDFSPGADACCSNHHALDSSESSSKRDIPIANQECDHCESPNALVIAGCRTRSLVAAMVPTRSDFCPRWIISRERALAQLSSPLDYVGVARPPSALPAITYSVFLI